MEFEIRLSGSVGIWSEKYKSDLGSTKTRMALAALAWDAGRTVGVETLIHRIWDEHPPLKAREALHAHMSRIRQALRMVMDEAPSIISRTNSYVMHVDPERIDLRRYIAYVEQTRSFRDGGDRGEALNLLDQAAVHWHGEPLTGIAGSWPDHLRTVVGETGLVATTTRAEIFLAEGRFADAVPVLLPLAAERPVDERLAELAAVALYGASRTAEATKLLQRTRQRVVRDIGLDAGRGLRRVHQGILAGTPAVSLLGPTGAGKTPFSGHTAPAVPDNLPRDVPWVGRREELGRLSAALCEANGAAVVTVEAIDGMGGVGKTALAVHAAHSLRDRFPDGRIYLHLGGRAPEPTAPASTRALTELLRLIGFGSKEMPNNLDELTALWRSVARDRRMLVILDDAAGSEHVLPLLPGASPTVIVVTSRRRLTGLPGVRPFFLDLLPPDDAADLFLQRLGPRPGTDRREVAEIVRICNYLPLAIEIAACRLLARPSWTTLDLLRQLRAGSGRLSQLHDGERTMTHVFAMSYRALSVEQQLTFRRIGLHIGVEFGPPAVAALVGCTVETAERLLEELLSHRLVSEPTPHRFTMHDLLRDYARALADAGDPDTDEDIRRAVRNLVDHYVRTADRADRLAYPFRPRIDLDPATNSMTPLIRHLHEAQDAERWLITEGANLLEALEWLSVHGPERHLALAVHALAGFLDMEVPLAAAESLLRRAVTHWRDSGDHPSEARALLDLGAVQTHGSRYDDATSTVEAARTIARSLGDREVESECVHQLCILLWQTGRYSDAQALQRRSLDYLKSTGDVLRISRSQNVLGVISLHLDQHHEAREYFTSALSGFTAIGDRRGRYSTLNNLGKIAQRTGDPESAADIYREAMVEARGMSNRRDWATLRMNYASALESLGNTDGALEWYEIALSAFRAAGDQRGEAITLNGLGRACRLAGRLEEAMGRHIAALALIRRIRAVGDECEALHDLALAERDTGRIKSAAVHMEESLALSRTLRARFEQARAEGALAEIRARVSEMDRN